MSSYYRPSFPTGPVERRPVSPPPAEPVKKKAKGLTDNEIKCPVCDISPIHLIKDCPAVRAGSKRFVVIPKKACLFDVIPQYITTNRTLREYRREA
jgi:hypothetical protein